MNVVILNKRANPIFTPKWQEEKSIGKANYIRKKKEFMTVQKETSPPTNRLYDTILFFFVLFVFLVLIAA